MQNGYFFHPLISLLILHVMLNKETKYIDKNVTDHNLTNLRYYVEDQPRKPRK